jgi:hypothetical protein
MTDVTLISMAMKPMTKTAFGLGLGTAEDYQFKVYLIFLFPNCGLRSQLGLPINRTSWILLITDSS